MYENCFRHLITKPTRLTMSSYTCIDNIFTNVIDKPIIPCILFFSDITDHLPIFHITKSHYAQNDYKSKRPCKHVSKQCLLITFHVNYTPPTGQVLTCVKTLTLGMKPLWIYLHQCVTSIHITNRGKKLNPQNHG